MSLRDNLQALRPGHEDPTCETVYELVVDRSLGAISLYVARRKVWTWWFPAIRDDKFLLGVLGECVRDLECTLNVFRLEIAYDKIVVCSIDNKPQVHVAQELNGIIAGMRQFARLGGSRELAMASMGSVHRIVVRVEKISREAAQIARAREAGHPAVSK